MEEAGRRRGAVGNLVDGMASISDAQEGRWLPRPDREVRCRRPRGRPSRRDRGSGEVALGGAGGALPSCDAGILAGPGGLGAIGQP